MPALALRNVTKRFAGQVVGVDGLTLEVEEGELLVLAGPSGCGKTTALRLAAGLEVPDSGQVWMDGRDLTGRPPAERSAAFVAEQGSLYPHMTVRENMAFAVRHRRWAKLRSRRSWSAAVDPWRPSVRSRVEQGVQRQVRRTAEMLDLVDWLDRRPEELSAGQRSRAALARAVARRPKVLLLDEPLANLDGPLRLGLRRELKRWQRQSQTTVVCVTHDQADALALADRLAVISGGRLQQIGRPEDVYRRPANLFVAGFLGSPPMNLTLGVLRREDGRWTFAADGWQATWDVRESPHGESDGWSPGRKVLGVRPGDLRIVDRNAEAARPVECGEVEFVGSWTVQAVETTGDGWWVTVESPFGGLLTADVRRDAVSGGRPEVGRTVGVAVRIEGLFVYDEQ